MLDKIRGHRTFLLTCFVVFFAMWGGCEKLDGMEYVDFVRELGILILGLAGLWTANEVGAAGRDYVRGRNGKDIDSLTKS